MSTSTLSGFSSHLTPMLRNTYSLLAATLLFSGLMATIGMQMALGPLAHLVLFIVSLGVLFGVMKLRNSPWGIALVFVFTGLSGLTLGPVLTHYLSLPGGAAIVAMAAGTTGAMFAGLSGYVLVTRRNFDFLGGMLFVALIGLVVASLIGLFFPVGVFQLILAFVSALVFSGYILYDTSRIIHGGETNYVMATISLYLNILNLFQALLRIFGVFGSNDD